MTAATDRTESLTQSIRTMLADELPAVASLGEHLAMITAAPNEDDPTRIDITVTPVDFQADCVEVSVSIRIDSITRVEALAAITAGPEI